MYLKGFTIPERPSHVYVYSRGMVFAPRGGRKGRNPACRSTRRAGVTRDAYAFEDRDGSANYEEVENALEQIERSCNPILEKLRAQKRITISEKQSFARYVVFMLKRVTARFKATRRKADGFVDSFDWDGLQRKLQLAGKFGLARQVAFRDDMLPRLKNGVHKLSIVTAMPDTVAALGKMTWRFLVAPIGIAFVTADNPVLFDRSAGIARSTTILWFPLSSRIVLQADWRTGEDLGYTTASQSGVDAVNHATCASAHLEVYAAVCEEWICKQLNLPKSV